MNTPKLHIVSVAIAIVAIVMGSIALDRTPSVVKAAPDQILAPGDVLDILVLGDGDLTRTVTVRPDGKISLPLLGELEVAGLTPAQLADLLSTRLRQYLKNPSVTVTVSHVAPSFVTVMGVGITHPGAYEMHSGWTVMDAIVAAGGVAPRAALRRAVLIRRGKPDPMPLDLERVLTGDLSANVPLQPGDTIVVPGQQMRVVLLGMISGPGPRDLDEGTRLLDAVAYAGGPAGQAALDAVGVIRKVGDDKLAVQTYDLLKVMQQGDMSQNPVLQNGDIIFVPQYSRVDWSGILAWIAGLRFVFGP